MDLMVNEMRTYMLKICLLLLMLLAISHKESLPVICA